MTKKSLGGNLLNPNQHKNWPKKLQCKNFAVYKLVHKLVHKHKQFHCKMTIKVMMKRRKKMTKKLVFIWSWENTKNLNTCNFILEVKIMEHVDRNRIHNYIFRYSIQDTENFFNKIGEMIKQRYFYLFWKILYINDNCRIIEE